MAEDWDAYGYVVSSEHRIAVMLQLSNSNLIPSKISDNTELPLPHVSNALSGLREQGLVVCLTPDRTKGRVYSTTEKGEWLVDQL